MAEMGKVHSPSRGLFRSGRFVRFYVKPKLFVLVFLSFCTDVS